MSAGSRREQTKCFRDKNSGDAIPDVKLRIEQIENPNVFYEAVSEIVAVPDPKYADWGALAVFEDVENSAIDYRLTAEKKGYKTYSGVFRPKSMLSRPDETWIIEMEKDTTSWMLPIVAAGVGATAGYGASTYTKKKK